jgi:HTH-type transcriptional regulator / antitoxin HigA
MAISPIHTDADHEAALRRIEVLWNAEPGTPECDEFEALVAVVVAYEDEHWPILPPEGAWSDSANQK